MMPVSVNNGLSMPSWYDVYTLDEGGEQVGKHLALHKITITFPPEAYLSYFLQDKEGLNKAEDRISKIVSNEVSSYQHGVSKCNFNTLGCDLVLVAKAAIIYSSPQFTLWGVPHLSQIENGIPASQIIVGGFSQGGVVAITHSLRSNVKLGGCCVIATWVPLQEEYPKSFGKAATSIPFWQGHGDADNVVNHDAGKRCIDFLRSVGVSADFELFHHVGHHTCAKQIDQASKFIRKCTNQTVLTYVP